MYSGGERPFVAGTSFDIYQSSRGYVTVSNNVQRLVLAAATERRSFQDLVQATGRSKPTVSLQIKDLVAQDLLEEEADPSDARRKYYRLKAQRIGSSDIPVQELSSAVKDYVKRASDPMVSLPVVVQAIIAAGARDKQAWAQGDFLGRSLAPQMQLAPGDDDAWLRLSKFLERAGLAKPLRIDLAQRRMDCELDAGLRGPVPAVAAALGGLANGAWATVRPKGVGHSAKGRTLSLWEKPK
jgi:hypothetical protein